MNRRMLVLVSVALLLLTPVTYAQDKQEETGLEEFDQAMTDLLARWSDVPGGQVALMFNGTLVFNQGYGMADTGSETPVSVDSRFRIASLSKAVTSAAILTLIQNGTIALDDKMVDLIPDLLPSRLDGCDYPNHAASYSINDITVSQILNHRAGWNPSSDPTYWHWNTWEVQSNECLDIDGLVTDYDGGNLAPIPMERILTEWLRRPLNYEPGEQYIYSNIGYQILGQIVEAQSGMGYEAYVQQNVLAPMGITSMEIGMTMPDARAEGEVSYYDYEGTTGPCHFPSGQDGNGDPIFPTSPDPDCGDFVVEEKDGGGGWIATSADYAKFIAHIDGTLTSSAFNNSFDYFTQNPDDNSGTFYGRGVSIVGGDTDVWDHNGAFSGSSTRFKRDVTESGESVIAVLFINSKPSGTVDGKSWKSDRSTTMSNAMMAVDYDNLTADEEPSDDTECTPGDTQPADDGCNNCFCTDDGVWACTLKGCGDGEEESTDNCTQGDTMPADDGCNNCVCMEDGNWACTEMGCPDDDGNITSSEQTPALGLVLTLSILCCVAIATRRRIEG